MSINLFGLLPFIVLVLGVVISFMIGKIPTKNKESTYIGAGIFAVSVVVFIVLSVVSYEQDTKEQLLRLNGQIECQKVSPVYLFNTKEGKMLFTKEFLIFLTTEQNAVFGKKGLYAFETKTVIKTAPSGAVYRMHKAVGPLFSCPSQ